MKLTDLATSSVIGKTQLLCLTFDKTAVSKSVTSDTLKQNFTSKDHQWIIGLSSG